MTGKPINPSQDEVELLTPEELEAVKEGLQNGTITITPIDHLDDGGSDLINP